MLNWLLAALAIGLIAGTDAPQGPREAVPEAPAADSGG